MSLFDAILAGKLTGGSLPKPIPYAFMPEGYPRSEFGTVTLLDVTDLAFDGDPSIGEYYSGEEWDIPLVVGQKYTVTWDGVEYANLVAFESSEGGNAIGAEWGEWNEELPFTLMNDALLWAVTNSDAATHSVKITQFGEVVTPLARKFHDKLVVKIAEDESGYAANKPFAEVYEALSAFEPVYFFSSFSSTSYLWNVVSFRKNRIELERRIYTGSSSMLIITIYFNSDETIVSVSGQVPYEEDK